MDPHYSLNAIEGALGHRGDVVRDHNLPWLAAHPRDSRIVGARATAS